MFGRSRRLLSSLLCLLVIAASLNDAKVRHASDEQAGDCGWWGAPKAYITPRRLPCPSFMRPMPQKHSRRPLQPVFVPLRRRSPFLPGELGEVVNKATRGRAITHTLANDGPVPTAFSDAAPVIARPFDAPTAPQHVHTSSHSSAAQGVPVARTSRGGHRELIDQVAREYAKSLAEGKALVRPSVPTPGSVTATFGSASQGASAAEEAPPHIIFTARGGRNYFGNQMEGHWRKDNPTSPIPEEKLLPAEHFNHSPPRPAPRVEIKMPRGRNRKVPEGDHDLRAPEAVQASVDRYAAYYHPSMAKFSLDRAFGRSVVEPYLHLSGYAQDAHGRKLEGGGLSSVGKWYAGHKIYMKPGTAHYRGKFDRVAAEIPPPGTKIMTSIGTQLGPARPSRMINARPYKHNITWGLTKEEIEDPELKAQRKEERRLKRLSAEYKAERKAKRPSRGKTSSGAGPDRQPGENGTSSQKSSAASSYSPALSTHDNAGALHSQASEQPAAYLPLQHTEGTSHVHRSSSAEAASDHGEHAAHRSTRRPAPLTVPTFNDWTSHHHGLSPDRATSSASRQEPSRGQRFPPTSAKSDEEVFGSLSPIEHLH